MLTASSTNSNTYVFQCLHNRDLVLPRARVRCYLRHYERRRVAGEIEDVPFFKPGGDDCVGLAVTIRVEGREVRKGRRAQDGDCEERRKDGYIAEGDERVPVAKGVVDLGYCAFLQGD